jgi:hypothetical protein
MGKFYALTTVVICFAICMSCVTQTTKQKRSSHKFNELISTANANAVWYDKNVFHFDDIEYIREGKAIIYVANSECSICLGNLLSFVKDLSDNVIRDKVYIVVEDGTAATVKYYLRESKVSQGLDRQIDLLENKDNRYVDGLLVDYNSQVFVLLNGQVVNSFKYDKI